MARQQSHEATAGSIVLTPDGRMKHLEMDIGTLSEPRAQQLRHGVADVDGSDVRISKKDSTG